MSSVEVIAVVVLAVWLALLSAMVLLAVRQVAVLTIQVDRNVSTNRTAREGPVLGSRLSAELERSVPEIGAPLGYLLLLSASCTPCHALAPKLRSLAYQADMATCIAGDATRAAQIASHLPSWMRIIRDPEAASIAALLDVDQTPYVMEFQYGRVTAKSWVHSARDLRDLFQTGQRTARARPLEVPNAT